MLLQINHWLRNKMRFIRVCNKRKEKTPEKTLKCCMKPTSRPNMHYALFLTLIDELLGSLHEKNTVKKMNKAFLSVKFNVMYTKKCCYLDCKGEK